MNQEVARILLATGDTVVIHKKIRYSVPELYREDVHIYQSQGPICGVDKLETELVRGSYQAMR